MQTLSYVIVCTETAGIFCGWLSTLDDVARKAVLKDSRVMWRWIGKTINHIALIGPEEGSQFPPPVPLRIVYGVKEVLYCSAVAQSKLEAVPLWK